MLIIKTVEKLSSRRRHIDRLHFNEDGHSDMCSPIGESGINLT